MAICGKCGRVGSVAEIRACSLSGVPHNEGASVPKVKWADMKTSDIEDAKSTGGSLYEGELPTSGTYVWNSKTFKLNPSNSSGNQMVEVLWLLDGAASGHPEFDGAPWFDNFVMVKQNAWKPKQFCEAMKIPYGDFLDMVVDEEGNITKMGSLAVKNGVTLKANVKRKPNREGDLKLDFGQYFPLHKDDDEKPAKPGKKAKAGKATLAAEPEPEKPAGKAAKASGKKGKKAKDDEPPF